MRCADPSAFYVGSIWQVPIPPIAVNEKQAAALLGLSVAQLRRLGLPSFKGGRTTLYRAPTLDAWAREQEETNRWGSIAKGNVTARSPQSGSLASDTRASELIRARGRQLARMRSDG